MRSFKHKNSSRSLQQGAIGLRVLKSGQLTGRQLEQARRELVNKKVNKKKKYKRFDIAVCQTSLSQKNH